MWRSAASTSRLNTASACAWSVLIVALVWVSFRPVLSAGFLNWDDIETVTSNDNIRGLTPGHLRWMVTTLYMGPYQPLTWLSHAVVYGLYGLNPLAHHCVNLVLHTANALLFFVLVAAVLQQSLPLTDTPRDLGMAAAVGALLFAIHPLRVEAVAWVTERRELLGAFFLLLAVLAYVRTQQTRVHRRWWVWFVFSNVCFALSLLSKAMGMTLPLLLLLLDTYPFHRFEHGADVRQHVWVLVEKVPYVVLAAAAATIAFAGQRTGPMATLAEHGVGPRLAQAAYGLCFYLWKTVMPTHLSPLYLLPRPLDPTQPKYVLCAAAVCGATIGLILWRRRAPWALAAWLGYVIILLPVLGGAQTGPQIAADRYTYLACLPWALLAGGAVYWLGPNRVAQAAVGLGLAVLSTLTVRQARVWESSITLWDQALQVDTANYIAYNNRGVARRAIGDAIGARADFEQAVELNPLYFFARVNRAGARRTAGDLDGAIADYTELIRRSPRYVDAYNARGLSRLAKGDAAGAVADFGRAVELTPPGAAHRSALERNLDSARQQLAGRASH